MTLRKIPCIDGCELDFFSAWRKILRINSKECKRIKRKYNKRMRQKVKQLIAIEYDEYCKIETD